MRGYNSEGRSNKDMCTSDIDGDGNTMWNKELLHTVRLRAGELEKDPEGVKLSVIKVYLDGGANINAQDEYGDTALHMAVENGYLRIVDFLRQRGARYDIQNSRGETAITLAETLHKKDVVTILKKFVEQPNQPELVRRSPETNESAVSAVAHEQEPSEGKTYVAAATLTRSWPGIAYQWKNLVFTLNCAFLQEDSDFLLATEMVAAEKLDDVVLLYKNYSGKKVGRFVQIKYTSDNVRKITARQLLDAGGDFSVPRYFVSWRKVKKNELFRELEVRNMILCTNTGLDLNDLEKNEIHIKNTGDPDKSFELRSASAVKRTAWYKFSMDKESGKRLYRELEESSDVYNLPKTVAKFIYDRKPMNLENKILQNYHIALVKNVFDNKNKKFHDNFIRDLDLPQRVKKFREIFLSEFGKSSGIDPSTEKIWKEIETRFEKLEFRRDFGEAPADANANSPREYELPDDHVDPAEISEFFEDFTLAVNQPSEDELNEIIRAKIGANSGFNLLNTELLDCTFQTKMLDWLMKTPKQEKRKEYLSYKLCKKFFEDMSNEIRSLITIGVNSIYCEQMKEYDVHFELEMQTVKTFVTEDRPSNRILELVAPGNTLLAALWVYDTLERIPKYKKMDSYIFTRVESLKLSRILNSVKTTFASLLHPDLLIVNCESNSAEQYLQTLWNPLCDIIAKNDQKRMIVITQTGKELGTQFKLDRKFYRVEKENLSFRNLTNDSQKKLLNKPVTRFQGHKNETSFGELLGISASGNHLSADESEDLSRVIDTETLVEVIRSDEMEIGEELEGLDEVVNYYSDRTIRRHVHIKETILDDKELPDLLAISADNNKVEIGTRNLTILDSNREEEQFNALCAENEDRNVHWLEKERGKYVWIKSQGDMTHLVQHRDDSECGENHDIKSTTYLSEDELTDLNEPVIISATAGMGKSTMLTHLAWKIKAKEPDTLVLKFNLNHHTTALVELKQKSSYDLGNINGAVKFLVKKLLSRETNLAQKVFGRIMERKHKLALIFDDFDETSPTYEGIVIDLIKTLADYGIKKLFVATRPHTRVALETKLNAFSYTIQPLSTDAQERFFIDFWKAKFGDTDHDSKRTIENRIKIYTTAMMERLADLFKDQGNKFTGVPLNAKLVAEIFENHSEVLPENFYSCQEFIFSEMDEPKFPDKASLICLYKHLVDKKFDIFFKKRGGNLADVAVIEDRRQRYKTFVDKHKRLALDTLFEKEKIKQLLSQQDVTHVGPESSDADIPVERDGIVTEFIDGVPRFGHGTYAEYFAAKFFSDTLKKREQNESFIRVFVEDILLAEKYKTTRAFIDWLLSDEHANVLDDRSLKLHMKTHRSQFEETIFHVAAAEGNGHIIKLLLNCFWANGEDPKNLKVKAGKESHNATCNCLCR